MNNKTLIFTKRNIKEILRDPTNLFFGLGFPLIILSLLSIVNSNLDPEIRNSVFDIQSLAPGIATFGPVFMSLFAGTLISKDRTTSFLMKLFTSPMSASNFILGYTLPLIIITLFQSLITFLVAIVFGFNFTLNTLLGVLVLIPITILFIATGLICGSIMSDKAVGGFCGALLTNIAGWFGGVWFPLEQIGGNFKKICTYLPFYHAAEATRNAVNGLYSKIIPHLIVVSIYAVILIIIAILIFNKKMQDDNQ